MAPPRMALELLQRPVGSMEILLYLQEHGPTSVTRLVEDTGIARDTFYSAVARLKELRLVFERPEHGWPSKTYYGLTAAGERVAGKLSPVEELLQKTLTGYEQKLRALESEGKGDTAVAIGLRLTLAEAAVSQGEWDRAQGQAKKAAEDAERLGDPAGALRAYLALGSIQAKRGDPAAHGTLERAMSHAREIPDPARGSEAAYLLGSAEERRGRFAEAEARYHDASDLARAAKSSLLMGRAQLGLGRLLGLRGLYSESCARIQEAIAGFESAGEEGLSELPKALVALALSTAYQGDNDRASALYERAIAAAERQSDVRTLGYALSNLAACRIHQRMLARAKECLDRARDIFTRLEETRMLASVELLHGSLDHARHEWEGSERHFKASLDLYERVGQKDGIADALLHYGRMEGERRDVEKAHPLLQRALQLYEEIGNKDKALKARKALEGLSSGTRPRSRRGTSRGRGRKR